MSFFRDGCDTASLFHANFYQKRAEGKGKSPTRQKIAAVDQELNPPPSDQLMRLSLLKG
jgi:hypothetical protein